MGRVCAGTCPGVLLLLLQSFLVVLKREPTQVLGDDRDALDGLSLEPVGACGDVFRAVELNERGSSW